MQWKEISLAILAGIAVLGSAGAWAAFQDEVNDKPKDKKDNGSKRGERWPSRMTRRKPAQGGEGLKKS